METPTTNFIEWYLKEMIRTLEGNLFFIEHKEDFDSVIEKNNIALTIANIKIMLEEPLEHWREHEVFQRNLEFSKNFNK